MTIEMRKEGRNILTKSGTMRLDKIGSCRKKADHTVPQCSKARPRIVKKMVHILTEETPIQIYKRPMIDQTTTNMAKERLQNITALLLNTKTTAIRVTLTLHMK